MACEELIYRNISNNLHQSVWTVLALVTAEEDDNFSNYSKAFGSTGS